MIYIYICIYIYIYIYIISRTKNGQSGLRTAGAKPGGFSALIPQGYGSKLVKHALKLRNKNHLTMASKEGF